MSHVVAPETVMKAVHVVEVCGGIFALLAVYAGIDEYRTRKRSKARQSDQESRIVPPGSDQPGAG